MVLPSAALGLLTTALVGSLYRMPQLWPSSGDNKNNEMETRQYERYANNYTPQRQYVDPPPPRFSLDRFVNRLFRRPYMADVRPQAYRRRPFSYQHQPPAAPIWHSQSNIAPLPSNSYYTYSQFGMPIASTNDEKPFLESHKRKKGKNTKRRQYKKKFSKLENPKRKQKNNGPNDQVVDDDDYDDDHYYYGDFESFDPFLKHNEDNVSSGATTAPTLQNVSHKDGLAGNDKDGTDKYVANPSKKNYSLSKRKFRKQRSTTTTTTTTSTESSKDCSPATKVNYHYHMYMIKHPHLLAGGHALKSAKKSTTTTTTTTTSSPYPVYEATSQQTQLTAYFESPSPVYLPKSGSSASDRHHIPAHSYSDKHNPDYDFQMVTSSSYIAPYDSYDDMSSNYNGEIQKQLSSHFDSDYYNSLLFSKIFGLNPDSKAMPIENYATESHGAGPLTKYDKTYKNAKALDASKVFKYDEKSKLYVPLEKNRKDDQKSKVKSKPS